MRLGEFITTIKTLNVAFSRYMSADPNIKNEQLQFSDWLEQFNMFIEERYSEDDVDAGWN